MSTDGAGYPVYEGAGEPVVLREPCAGAAKLRPWNRGSGMCVGGKLKSDSDRDSECCVLTAIRIVVNGSPETRDPDSGATHH